MDYYEREGIKSCYIGRTKYSAGIFLSMQVAKRKKYGKYLKFTVYPDFAEAEKAFWSEYSDVIEKQNFRLNQLYPVAEKPLYSVFSTWYHVGMTYGDNCFECADMVLPKNSMEPYWEHNLTYDDAITIVKNHFVKMYKDYRYYIHFPIRLHEVISLNDVKRANRVQ